MLIKGKRKKRNMLCVYMSVSLSARLLETRLPQLVAGGGL